MFFSESFLYLFVEPFIIFYVGVNVSPLFFVGLLSVVKNLDFSFGSLFSLSLFMI